MKKLLGMLLVLTMFLSVFSVSFSIENFDDNTKNALERSINSGNANSAEYAAMSLLIMSEYNFQALYEQAEKLAAELDEESLNEDITTEDLEEIYNVESMKEFLNYMETSGGIEAMNDVSDYLEHVMGKYETTVSLSQGAVRNLMLNLGMEEYRMDEIENSKNYPEEITSDYRDFLTMKIMSEMILIAYNNKDMYFDNLEKMGSLIEDPMNAMKPKAQEILEKYEKRWEQTPPGIMDFDTILRDFAAVDGDAEWVSLSDVFTDEFLYFDFNKEMLVEGKDMVGYILDMNDFEVAKYDENREYLNITDLMFSEVRNEMYEETPFELKPRIATDFMNENLIDELSEENLNTTIKIGNEEVYTIRKMVEKAYAALPYGDFLMNFAMSTWDPTMAELGLEEFKLEFEIYADFNELKDGYNLSDLNIKVKPGVVMNALNLIGYVGSASSEETLSMLNGVIDDIGFLFNEDGDLVMKMGEPSYYVSIRMKDILNAKLIEALLQSMSGQQQY
ncbi:MAG: hypothetical protein ACQESN_09490 [Thermotogota bacterium]